MSGNHRDKRRKVGGAPDQEHVQETFKLSTRFKPTQPREWTVSVAIPSSLIADCSSAEQRINSPSRIARALAVFSIDEVVIFDDSPLDSRPPATDLESYTGDTDPCHYIWHLLSYMETPPFMRKNLFPLHPNLRLQGLLPSLDMPHHPHRDEQLPYMEGMTLDRRPDGGKGTMVEIGMRQPIKIDETIPPRTRVTLHFPNQSFEGAQPVHPTAPRTDGGYYWGYSIRKCSSISAVFTESPWEDGYDISIGTSERGLPASKAFPPGRRVDFKHLLIVFGGPRGLEFATMNDPELSDMGTGGIKTRELFDHWINVLPDQGSRTIRTDEAIFIALAELRRVWHQT